MGTLTVAASYAALALHARRQGGSLIAADPAGTPQSGPEIPDRLRLPAGARRLAHPLGLTSSRRQPLVESRCGAGALGRTYLFPPLSSGGAVSGSPLTPFPHPAHRTGRADFPHPALGQDLTPLLGVRRHLQFLNPLRSF